MIYLLFAAFAYFLFEIIRNPSDKCENPDCKNCPFPNCREGEK